VEEKGEKIDTVVGNTPHLCNMLWGMGGKLITVVDKPALTSLAIKFWDLSVSPMRMFGDRAAFSNDGKQIIALDPIQKCIRVFDATTQKETKSINWPFEMPMPVSPDFTMGVTYASEFTKVYSLELLTVIFEGEGMKPLCFSPDSLRICINEIGKRVAIKGIRGASDVNPVQIKHPGLRTNITAASFSHNQRYLFLGITNRTKSILYYSQLYDLLTKEVHVVTSTQVDFASFSENESLVAFSSTKQSKAITGVYNISEKKMTLALSVSANWVVFSPTTKNVILLGHCKEPFVEWWTTDGHLLHRFYLEAVSTSVSVCPTKDLVLLSADQQNYILTHSHLNEGKQEFEHMPFPPAVLCTQKAEKERKDFEENLRKEGLHPVEPYSEG